MRLKIYSKKLTFRQFVKEENKKVVRFFNKPILQKIGNKPDWNSREDWEKWLNKKIDEI